VPGVEIPSFEIPAAEVDGETYEGVAVDETTPEGTVREEGRALNRRVVINVLTG
jgi:outer membrane protein OmpA-like peptidoglycan-associated protein